MSHGHVQVHSMAAPIGPFSCDSPLLLCLTLVSPNEGDIAALFTL